MKHFIRGYGVLLFLLFTLTGCLQQDAVAPKSSPSMHWIEDESGTLTFDEIINKNLSTQWNPAQQHSPNFGFTQSAYWLSLPFENAKDVQTSMLLEIAFPLHDSIDVYLLNGNEVVATYNAGDQHPFAQRPINHRHFLFPYTAPPNTKLRAIIRIQSTDTMYIPVKVWESNSFFVQAQHETLFLGICFGILSIMLIYNLFLYILTSEKNYLYYTFFTSSLIYLQLTQKTLGYQYIWPEQSFFNFISFPISSLIAIAASSFFILNFLNLDKKAHAKPISILQTITYISLTGFMCIAATSFFDLSPATYSKIITATAALGAAMTITVMGMLINLSIQGNQSAKILSIAWLSLLVGSLLFVLGRLGLPVPMLITENALLIGSTFEAALISFALARHIKIEREARMHAQELALANERKTREAQNSLLALQAQTTQHLEQEVKERTFKLETAMQDLTLANHKLDNLARLDGLTGLSNRRNFDETFEQEWRSNLRQRLPISLIMVDIDHFKSINDTYGHIFGDKCLVKVAEILSKCVRRPIDLAARYGGEEFIVMLPNTNVKGAEYIAENIRHNIEKLRLNHQGQEIQFTISLGIANMVPTPDTESIDLLASADQALYLAKESGRNRVVTLDNSPRKKTSKPQKTARVSKTTALKPLLSPEPT